MWSLEDKQTRVTKNSPLSSKQSQGCFFSGKAMIDSGANLVVSNMATATSLGLEIFDYDVPITINFGGVKNVECTKYCDLGEILGRVAIVDNLPKTLVLR